MTDVCAFQNTHEPVYTWAGPKQANVCVNSRRMHELPCGTPTCMCPSCLVHVLTPVPDSMVLITDKFWGPLGAENVIGNVHLWLAEAINTLQDNKDTLTAKVQAGGHGGRGTGIPEWASCPPGPLWSPPRSSRAAGTPK